jgi:cysteine-rich repeat protein
MYYERCQHSWIGIAIVTMLGSGCGDALELEVDEFEHEAESARARPTVSKKCGNGIVDTKKGEACDDGNNSNTDACLNTCVVASCGDGFMRSGVEGCDDGNTSNDDACPTTCQPSTCGDGFVRTGIEECDDSNNLGGDGCDANCLLENVVPQAQVTAGARHTCALTIAGAVHCWGENDLGQLGRGDTTDIGDDEPASAPAIDLGGVAVAIDAGFSHTCALMASGNVRCWGDGTYGKLGYGNSSSIGDNEMPESAGDIDLGGTAVQISAGTAHTCALLDGGTIRCWGTGVDGRLGYGNIDTIGDDETPASVGIVDVGALVDQVVAYNGHTCALTNAQNVRCWGSGLLGRLGYGNQVTIGDDEPPAAAGDVPVGATVLALAPGMGFDHTCVLTTAGNMRCWGWASGALGYGDTNVIGDDETPATRGDINVGGTPVSAVSVGDSFTCAIVFPGDVRCWGKNGFGQLGQGNTVVIGDDELPVSVGPVGLGFTIGQVSVGLNHVCAATTSGPIFCWGEGGLGQLGYGNTNNIGDDEVPITAGAVPW